MNELLIQNALWHDQQANLALAVPNYTPARWWECDLFAVTKSGYWIEYEVKLSVADFKADAKKNVRSFKHARVDRTTGQWVDVEARNKHSLLAAGSPDGPSRFWYVMPKAVASRVTVPRWAGLKVVIDHPGHRPFICVEKAAPQIHKHKVSDEVRNHARGVCYWRFWNARIARDLEIERRIRRMTETSQSIEALLSIPGLAAETLALIEAAAAVQNGTMDLTQAIAALTSPNPA